VASTSTAHTGRKNSGHQNHRSTTAKTSDFKVGLTKFKLSEPAGTATPNAHSSSGAPLRSIPVGVRYPALGSFNGHSNPGAPADTSHGPYPLIIFSQGYDRAASTYAALIDAWTSAGYVVAAPTYPFTDPQTPGGPNETDIVYHPSDLRFVINTLVNGSGPASAIKRLIDPAHIAVIGHSDGGDVSLAVAANSCCRIPAVKAAVILSGAELARFGGSYFSGAAVPLLAVQGSADTINPPGCSAQLYDGAPQPKYYLDVIGASHIAPYTQPGRERAVVASVTTAFLNRYLKGQQAALSTLRRSADVAGVTSLVTISSVPGASVYCPGAP
jgi:predicted dienelactone hydrolase